MLIRTETKEEDNGISLPMEKFIQLLFQKTKTCNNMLITSTIMFTTSLL